MIEISRQQLEAWRHAVIEAMELIDMGTPDAQRIEYLQLESTLDDINDMLDESVGTYDPDDTYAEAKAREYDEDEPGNMGRS